ncbi:YqiA/YcfP family alpha/beta fold hydrolase [Oribacterium sp. WCC10]|uniref:YqiA/YcfP family alpha/beta fold hydrolase n=1 Tax=Oribacterium sp. WCC10 TaxID=1855343 RepID=UPI0008EA1B14|nr:YqiA/YcfP family alpha/beta fold hydrolase [Oribacterium sp. WCC10]SFG54747.1 hypothetical protein SAMN05216356_11291 [Oribacterium sp. WCC10]
MNILNIHGYAGSPENTNYSILQDAGYTVISFSIDYDNCSATDVEDFLLAAARVYRVDMIVATSYGSYFANIISGKYNLPFIATNPCVNPSISLRNLTPDYCFREAKYFKSRNREYMKNWETGIFILGNADEVIDHSITKGVVGKAKIYEVSGTHRLRRESYEILLLKEIESLMKEG